MTSKKIIDILKEKESLSDSHTTRPLVSIEYFPPRTDQGVQNLKTRMDRMRDVLQPAFTDVTWGAGGSTADLSMDLALYAQQHGHLSNLHMTCTNIGNTTTAQNPKEAILEALSQAHKGGIRNIVALRGDPPAGETEWKATEGGFTCARDLVQFIRQQEGAIGADFGIAVAGYPEGHPNAIRLIDDPNAVLTPTEQQRASTFDGEVYCCLDADYQKEMEYLKSKVDAGAGKRDDILYEDAAICVYMIHTPLTPIITDIIITQMFFDAQVFNTFVQDCRNYGIQCPIIPGLMCINNYAGFRKMTKFCKTRVPPTLDAQMEQIKDASPEEMKDFGIQFGVQMCKDILAPGDVQVLHFYTLNLEKVVYGITDGLGLTQGALQATNEADAASQVAKGSAWARVGDNVKTLYGSGTVLAVDQATGAAQIEIQSWTMAGGQKPTAYLGKSSYEKVF